MRLLKKEVNAVVSAIKSEFATARTSVGTGFGEGLTAAIFGRRAAGRANAGQRDALRREQIDAVEPYDRVKRTIEQIIHQLDLTKGQIELSPEFQIRTPKKNAVAAPALSPPTSSRFFLYLGDEVKGPYTPEQIHALRDTGAVTDQTQCCAEGSQQWIRCADEVRLN
jgi:hypothetical protein